LTGAERATFLRAIHQWERMMLARHAQGANAID
jgi:hypothetical protein